VADAGQDFNSAAFALFRRRVQNDLAYRARPHKPPTRRTKMKRATLLIAALIAGAALLFMLRIVSKIRGGGSLTGPGLSRKMWGRKIRPRRLSAIFLPGIFLLPPIFERIQY
jgi:hypothetical protein